MNVDYVCRLPPSPSGLALYAQHFLNVLSKKVSVTVFKLPSQPRDSQRFKEILLISRNIMKESKKGNIVLFDLGGRGLAEFWSSVIVKFMLRRKVWIVIHDPPTLCGSSFLFLSLDRKGFRRFAAMLSNSIGFLVECLLLAKVDQVICLSEAGSKSLAKKYKISRPIKTIPHLATPRRLKKSKGNLILVPGHVGEDDEIVSILEAMKLIPDDWHLKIGACSNSTLKSIYREVEVRDLTHRVNFLGVLDEQDYMMTFDEAAIVIRSKERWSTRKSNSCSVSGPLIYAMAAGCVIITNDSRGINDCLSDAGAIFVPDLQEGSRLLVDVIVCLVQDTKELAWRASLSLKHSRNHHSENMIAELLNEFNAD